MSFSSTVSQRGFFSVILLVFIVALAFIILAWLEFNDRAVQGGVRKVARLQALSGTDAWTEDFLRLLAEIEKEEGGIFAIAQIERYRAEKAGTSPPLRVELESLDGKPPLPLQRAAWLDTFLDDYRDREIMERWFAIVESLFPSLEVGNTRLLEGRRIRPELLAAGMSPPSVPFYPQGFSPYSRFPLNLNSIDETTLPLLRILGWIGGAFSPKIGTGDYFDFESPERLLLNPQFLSVELNGLQLRFTGISGETLQIIHLRKTAPEQWQTVMKRF